MLLPISPSHFICVVFMQHSHCFLSLVIFFFCCWVCSHSIRIRGGNISRNCKNRFQYYCCLFPRWLGCVDFYFFSFIFFKSTWGSLIQCIQCHYFIFYLPFSLALSPVLSFTVCFTHFLACRIDVYLMVIWKETGMFSIWEPASYVQYNESKKKNPKSVK